MTKEKAAEAVRNTIEPWINAINTWAAEGDKLQKLALDGVTQSIDNSHKYAKESLAFASSVTEAGRKQLKVQVERTVEYMTALVP